MSRKQAALYAETVTDLAEALQDADGIRQGHRAGDADAAEADLQSSLAVAERWQWAEADSGKWARLREIAEVVAARQEKMLVFTQFREMTAPLAAYLGGIFGRSGWFCTATPRSRTAGRWSGPFRRTRRCRSSSCP